VLTLDRIVAFGEWLGKEHATIKTNVYFTIPKAKMTKRSKLTIF